MDSLLKSMRTGQQAGEKFNKLTQNQLDDIVAKYGRETQALTDSVTRGTTSITSQAGYAKKSERING
jgi:rRNA pseudouridine-1189 N-methylase Emg1 (Nep1/Mra1 family)